MRIPSILALFVLAVLFVVPHAQAQVAVSLPSITGTVGTSETIALTVGDVTGQNITSYQFSISYDPTVVEITGATVGGTLSEGTSPTVNTATTASITVAWASASAVEGQGALIELSAELIGVGSSSLTITDFIFNEGTPAASTTNGNVTVENTTTPTVPLSMPASLTAPMEDGTFTIPVAVGSLNGLGVTSYAMTVTYNPAVLSITGASVGGTLSAGTPASVTTGNGTITVSWSGSALTGAGTLVNLQATPLAAGNSALTFGSASFNAGSPTAVTTNGAVTVTQQSTGGPVGLSLPATFTGTERTSVKIPVTIGDVTGRNVNSYQMTIAYDIDLVNIVGASVEGTLSSSSPLFFDGAGTGQATIVWASGAALTGEGVLLNLDVNLRQAGTTALTFVSAALNEGTPAVTTTNGQVTIEGESTPGRVPVTLSERTGTVGESLLIPVTVGDVTEAAISAFEFTLTFDPSLISVGVEQGGTLTAGTSATVNTGTPGQVTVAWASVNELTGAGALVNLRVDLMAVGESALTFSSFSFNEGSPEATITNGSVAISPDASIINVSLPQNATGNVGETLTVPVTVGSTTDGAITAFSFTLGFDGSLVQVDDATLQGTIASGGAVTVDKSTPGQIGVAWEGPALTGAGTLVALSVNLVSDGSASLTFVDFTFNDGAPQASLENGTITISGNNTLGLSIPAGLMGAVGEQVSIPINAGMLTGRNVRSYSFTVTFDAAKLTIAAADAAGTLSAGAGVEVSAAPGQITVTYDAAEPLTGSGTLVKLVANLESPGMSALTFAAFELNDGSPEAATIDGSITVHGVSSSLQLIHNSPDAPIVDIYVNDQKVVDGLSYASATAFLPFETAQIKIDVVNDLANTNNNPIASTTVTLINDLAYVGVLNGLFAGSGKQALGIVVEETVREASGGDTIDLLVFQGSPDAPPMTINIVDDGGQHATVAALGDDVAFGDGRLAEGLEPGLYHLELLDASGEVINTYRADLSRTAGAALLLMVQGFVNPQFTQPDLTVTAYAPDGRGIFLPRSTAADDDLTLPGGFALKGNYPNPFNPTTSIQFELPEPAEVTIDVFDLLGRQVLSLPGQAFTAGDRHEARVDATELASGTYVYRVTARGAQQTYFSSDTMTLLK